MPKKKEKCEKIQTCISAKTSNSSLYISSSYDSRFDTLATLTKLAESWIQSEKNEISQGAELQCKSTQTIHEKQTQSPAMPVLFNFLDSTMIDDQIEDIPFKHMNKEEKEYYFSLNGEARKKLTNISSQVDEINCRSIPFRFRVLDSRLPLELKSKILQKLNSLNDGISLDNSKYYTWLEILLSLPHSLIIPQPDVDIIKTIKLAKETLNKVIYGHNLAKNAILQRLYQWLINPYASQRPLGLLGVPGNGKTSLIRFGMAKVMNRPFSFVSLGGSCDSSTLAGHNYTYEGSTPGRIVENLIEANTLNPVIYYDELDKISATQRGAEISNMLIHLTDPSQNDKWKDRYIGNLDINLSCSLSVFSFNSTENISPILLDRLQIVLTDEFDSVEQASIASTHLLPSIYKDFNHVNANRVFINHQALLELSNSIGKGGLRQMRSILEQALIKGCMWIEIEDADILKPLVPNDFEISFNSYTIQRGLYKLLDDQKSDWKVNSMYS